MSQDYTFIIIPKKKKKKPTIETSQHKYLHTKKKKRKIEQIYRGTHRSQEIDRKKIERER